MIKIYPCFSAIFIRGPVVTKNVDFLLETMQLNEIGSRFDAIDMVAFQDGYILRYPLKMTGHETVKLMDRIYQYFKSVSVFYVSRYKPGETDVFKLV